MSDEDDFVSKEKAEEENKETADNSATYRVHRGNSDQKFKISFYFSSFSCISRDRELVFRS